MQNDNAGNDDNEENGDIDGNDENARSPHCTQRNAGNSLAFIFFSKHLKHIWFDKNEC